MEHRSDLLKSEQDPKGKIRMETLAIARSQIDFELDTGPCSTSGSLTSIILSPRR
jgi:hypothetical protein